MCIPTHLGNQLIVQNHLVAYVYGSYRHECLLVCDCVLYEIRNCKFYILFFICSSPPFNIWDDFMNSQLWYAHILSSSRLQWWPEWILNVRWWVCIHDCHPYSKPENYNNPFVREGTKWKKKKANSKSNSCERISMHFSRFVNIYKVIIWRQILPNKFQFIISTLSFRWRFFICRTQMKMNSWHKWSNWNHWSHWNQSEKEQVFF